MAKEKSGVDPVAQRFLDMEWLYATGDPKALRALEERIAFAGRKRSLITYSDLVRGVTFDLPNLQQSRIIDTSDWHDLDRAVVGSFLGYISMRSYERAKFFASALVVNKTDGSPGDGFYNLLRDLGLIPNKNSPKALDLWAEHVAKAHTWYTMH